jgi:predicted DNA-binding transcriptional regulator YafY
MDQKEILDELNRSFDPPLDRKTVRRNIECLVDMGFPIIYTIQNRKGGNDIWTDFYLERDFTEPELRLLIDGLLFSNHIPYRQCQDLIKKLEGLSSKYFHAHVKHIKTLPDNQLFNSEIFYTIEILGEAISAKKKASFQYVRYVTDKKAHPKLDSDGNPKVFISPYQMAAKDGKYYLICNYDVYDDISIYRIDRITNIKTLDDHIKPFSKLKDAHGKRFDLGEYMKTHIYMYSCGESRVRFNIVPAMESDILDIFGKEVIFEKETEEYTTVSAKVTEAAMLQFAKAHAPDVVILEPQELVDKMKAWAEDVKKVYDYAMTVDSSGLVSISLR